MGSTIHQESGKSRRVYSWNSEDERGKKKIDPFKATNKNELQHKIALSLCEKEKR